MQLDGSLAVPSFPSESAYCQLPPPTSNRPVCTSACSSCQIAPVMAEPQTSNDPPSNKDDPIALEDTSHKDKDKIRTAEDNPPKTVDRCVHSPNLHEHPVMQMLHVHPAG